MPYDYFLSYARQDNFPALPGRPDSEWVTVFEEILRGRVQVYLGRKVNVFFDQSELSGISALTPDLKKAIDESHLFVAISSVSYFKRPWCKLERDRFVQALGAQPVLAKRVFVIHTTDVDPLIYPQKWQAEFFPDLEGYVFFREKEKRMYTLGAPVVDPAVAEGRDYYLGIERLAQDISAQIREREKEPDRSPPASESRPSPTADVVFLAENAFRSRAEREELRVALREAGFAARPEASLAEHPAEALSKAMEGALAFVQIVSPVLAEIPGGEGATYDQRQLDAAQKVGLPRFRWRALDLDVAASAANFPGYTEFAMAHDVRQQLLPAFKADLLAALKGLRASQRVKQATQGDDRLVLITGDPTDVATHGGVIAQQLQNHALGYFIADSPAEEVQAEDVHGFLVLYGGGSAEWVRDRLKIVRTLPKTRRANLRVGVYFCPPPPEFGGRPLLFDMPSFHKIRWDDPPSLDAFAQEITQ